MRGVILAGGKGTRLGKLTSILNKHLVAVGEVPMIEYPLSTIEKVGAKDITIVTGAEHAGTIIEYLTNEHPEINFTYKVQKEAGGIAQALDLVETTEKNFKIAVILGDNIFEEDFSEDFEKFKNNDDGAMIFLKEVSDPERSGVVEVKDGEIISIEEKPKEPKSNLICTGLYFFDDTVFNKIKKLRPSARGELEIVEVINMYLEEKKLSYRILNKYWGDAGTHESRKESEEYIGKVGIDKFINKK